MNGDEFFDRLYSRFHIHFPCYALYRKGGYVTRAGADGTAALVLLSDDDLAEQVARSAGRRSAPALVPIPDPDRLARIRNERRPNSKYASIDNCRYEVREGETMMRKEGIAWLSSTHKSIEEIATTILRDLRPDRLAY